MVLVLKSNLSTSFLIFTKINLKRDTAGITLKNMNSQEDNGEVMSYANQCSKFPSLNMVTYIYQICFIPNTCLFITYKNNNNFNILLNYLYFSYGRGDARASALTEGQEGRAVQIRGDVY